MSTEDDTELRDLLLHTLEKNGALAKIKAQLRACAFIALEEQQRAKKAKSPLHNEKARRFADTDSGRLCCEIVAEFLETLNLDSTLAVFKVEVPMGDRRTRSHLGAALDLKSTGDDLPLLSDLVKKKSSSLIEPSKQQPQRKPDQIPDKHGLLSKKSDSFNRLNSDDSEDSFMSSEKPMMKVSIEKHNIFSAVPIRETSNDGKSSAEDNRNSSGNAQTSLRDLPQLFGQRPALPPLTKDNPNRENFLNIFNSLDNPDESPRDRLVPGLDLNKLNKKDDQQKSMGDKLESAKEKAGKLPSPARESSVDEVSEEISDAFGVTDLLDSARSESSQPVSL